MKIAILGFGLEGKALLKFLKKFPNFKKSDIFVLDKKLDKNYLKNLEQFDIVFRSPGVPYNFSEIQAYEKRASTFGSGNTKAPMRILTSATKLFFQEARKIPSIKIIGITGTKGKGTTSTLLYKILKSCNKKVYLAGNIGKPAIEILPKLKKNSIVIVELSSFQLQDLNRSPDIAVVVDIFPDHMDVHKNMAEYLNAKANITKWQKKTDRVFYFSDNKYCRWIVRKSRGKKIPISVKNFRLFNSEKLKIHGFHSFKNAVMAANIALLLGCPKEKIIKTIKNFRCLEHRLEFIRTIRTTSASINFYNDSASTNPQAAAAAINAFLNEPKILIAGGKDKNLNYSPLTKALKNSNTKLVILYGENKNKIKNAIKNSGVPIKLTENLQKTVETAYFFIKNNSQYSHKFVDSHYVILFSPASASFDMFKDYKERGKKFKEIVMRLKTY